MRENGSPACQDLVLLHFGQSRSPAHALGNMVRHFRHCLCRASDPGIVVASSPIADEGEDRIARGRSVIVATTSIPSCSQSGIGRCRDGEIYAATATYTYKKRNSANQIFFKGWQLYRRKSTKARNTSCTGWKYFSTMPVSGRAAGSLGAPGLPGAFGVAGEAQAGMAERDDPIGSPAAGGMKHRFSVRDAVTVATVAGESLDWRRGTVVGVTFGTNPHYDVQLEATDIIVLQVPRERIAGDPPA